SSASHSRPLPLALVPPWWRRADSDHAGGASPGSGLELLSWTRRAARRIPHLAPPSAPPAPSSPLPLHPPSPPLPTPPPPPARRRPVPWCGVRMRRLLDRATAGLGVTHSGVDALGAPARTGRRGAVWVANVGSDARSDTSARDPWARPAFHRFLSAAYRRPD